MKTLPTNMSSLFEKLNDLKTMFKFAERVVPIVQGLTEFMKEVVPLLENINTSIAESTSKIPQASNQINNVTSATELATTEILDLVDEITASLDKSEKTLNKIIEDSTKESKTLTTLRKMLSNNSEATKLLDEYVNENKISNKFDDIIADLSKSRNDSYKITISLQVQDITTQQLAAVNHLIQSVHYKLAALIENIEQAELGEEVTYAKEQLGESQVTFDPNASYLNSEGRQEKVDEIIINQSLKTSQEEIDKLFG